MHLAQDKFGSFTAAAEGNRSNLRDAALTAERFSATIVFRRRHAPANRPLSHTSQRHPPQPRWASVRPPPARAERHLVWRKPVGYRQCFVFARLQGDFLSKHHIACGQTAIRHKTPTRLGMSRIVHLVHVHTRTMVDAVSLSAVATDDVEVGFGIELRALLR